jgi:hypothetical protein
MKPTDKLSDNLTLEEVTKSQTAIRKGISNEPTKEHFENLKAVALQIFQPLREAMGTAIYISSGYRSKALNDAVGGSLKSQHSHGQALDLDADVYGGVTNAELFDYILLHLPFDQLIWEFGDEQNPAWVHVSHTRGQNRGQVLRAVSRKGRTAYVTFDRQPVNQFSK